MTSSDPHVIELVVFCEPQQVDIVGDLIADSQRDWVMSSRPNSEWEADQDRIAALTNALMKYGQHTPYCGWDDGYAPCTSGS